MSVTVVAFAYNEIQHIPFMVQYYKYNQGCELLIVDNYSNDGTYEWLMDNHIPCIRVDTEESFHITRMQIALLDELKRITPDWLIYTGIDTYFIFPEGILNQIKKAEEGKYNTIQTRLIEVYNTGENYSVPMHYNYFYGEKKDLREMIVKYSPTMRILADRLILTNKKTLSTNGVLINYGMCKTKEEREETFRRREKAWKLGLSKTFGTHYKQAKEKQWIWNREKLKHLSTLAEWNMIKQQMGIDENKYNNTL